MLLAELQETQISQNTSKVSITMPSVIIAKNEQKIELPIALETTTLEKSAAKSEEKLGWLFDPIATIPTLAHQDVQQVKEVFEINEKLLPENHDLNDRLKENKTEVERYKAGDKQLTGFFMGKLMKVSNGKADPKIANSLLQQMLNT